MRLLSVVVSMFVLALFVIPGVAQYQSAHHPQPAQAVQADSSNGMGMMQGSMMQGGMMPGSMMGGKEKRQCCMMSGKRMMPGGMMGKKGMMGGKMGMHGPMHKFMHMVHHLPDLQAKLNLNNDQVSKLKQIRADFLKKQADWKAGLEKKQIDLGLLLDKNASASEVKKLLSSSCDTKVEMQVAAYQTATKMRALLTPEQRQKLKSVMTMGMCKMMGGKM